MSHKLVSVTFYVHNLYSLHFLARLNVVDTRWTSGSDQTALSAKFKQTIFYIYEEYEP